MIAWKDFKKISAYSLDGYQLEISELVSDIFANKITALEFTRWDQFSFFEYEVPIKYITYLINEKYVQVNLRLCDLEIFRTEHTIPLSYENIFFEPAYAEFIDFSMPYLIENHELKFKFDNFLELEVEFLDKQTGVVTDIWIKHQNFDFDFQVSTVNPNFKVNYLLNASKMESIDWLQKKGFANAYLTDLDKAPEPKDSQFLRNKIRDFVKNLTLN